MFRIGNDISKKRRKNGYKIAKEKTCRNLSLFANQRQWACKRNATETCQVLSCYLSNSKMNHSSGSTLFDEHIDLVHKIILKAQLASKQQPPLLINCIMCICMALPKRFNVFNRRDVRDHVIASERKRTARAFKQTVRGNEFYFPVRLLFSLHNRPEIQLHATKPPPLTEHMRAAAASMCSHTH